MGISRRKFIKASLLGTTALGLAGGVVSSGKWMEPKGASAEPQEQIAYTYHPPNCGGRCAMKCTVRDGRLVKIEPNEWPDKRYSIVCLKGLSEVERVYSPDRIKTPLKRVGERGEGKFVPISWDEALTITADKLKSIKEQFGGESILFSYSTGIEHPMPFLTALLGAQSVVEAGIDIGIANGFEECTGEAYFGAAYHEITDWVNANMVILIGANILETSLPDTQYLYDAKEAGAKIVSVDPTYSVTVAKSNQWVRIKPGTDSALLLAMIQVILENGWHQEDFLCANTSAPFLVHTDSKKLARDDESLAGGIDNPFKVWDKNSNSVQSYNTPGIDPALDGEFEFNGVKVQTVFSLLKENQQKYTASWAASITDIPEETIYNLAKEYATGGPAVLAWGWGGADKWCNADVLGHAAGILGSLTGNFGRVGGGLGNPIGHFITWSAALGSWKLPDEFKAAPLEMTTADRRVKANSVKAVVNLGNTFQQHFANLAQTEKWIQKLDFVVAVDPFHNLSVNYADIVLPACTNFESEYGISNMQMTRAHILLQQKVIEPLHESKSDFQIEKELAEKLGLAMHLPATPEDYQRARLHSTDPALQGITIESLQQNRFIMRLNVPHEPYIAYKDQVYKTASTKLELYHEKMIDDLQELPRYDDPQEAHEGSPLFGKYPLQFSQAHTRYRAHSQFTNALWINEIDPEPRVEMNKNDAEARSLRNGDMVEVFNDRGKFRARCKINNALRQGQIRLYQGWWSKHMDDGNLQNVTNDYMLERQYKLRYGPVIPFNDTLVEVQKIREVL